MAHGARSAGIAAPLPGRGAWRIEIPSVGSSFRELFELHAAGIVQPDVDGSFELPTGPGPGLGVELDLDMIAEHPPTGADSDLHAEDWQRRDTRATKGRG